MAPDTELTREEAWATYERNWRHIYVHALDARERTLLKKLSRALGKKPLLV